LTSFLLTKSFFRGSLFPIFLENSFFHTLVLHLDRLYVDVLPHYRIQGERILFLKGRLDKGFRDHD
jgi:hypothetical protein